MRVLISLSVCMLFATALGSMERAHDAEGSLISAYSEREYERKQDKDRKRYQERCAFLQVLLYKYLPMDLCLLINSYESAILELIQHQSYRLRSMPFNLKNSHLLSISDSGKVTLVSESSEKGLIKCLLAGEKGPKHVQITPYGLPTKGITHINRCETYAVIEFDHQTRFLMVYATGEMIRLPTHISKVLAVSFSGKEYLATRVNQPHKLIWVIDEKRTVTLDTEGYHDTRGHILCDTTTIPFALVRQKTGLRRYIFDKTGTKRHTLYANNIPCAVDTDGNITYFDTITGHMNQISLDGTMVDRRKISHLSEYNYTDQTFPYTQLYNSGCMLTKTIDGTIHAMHSDAVAPLILFRPSTSYNLLHTVVMSPNGRWLAFDMSLYHQHGNIKELHRFEVGPSPVKRVKMRAPSSSDSVPHVREVQDSSQTSCCVIL